jgi:hypothetical protein
LESSLQSNVEGTYRKLQAQIARGDGVVFKYGTQSGQGGFVLENNSIINGSLYSNGNIYGSNGAYITGDAIVAGPTGLIDNLDLGVGGTGNGFAHNITNLDCQSGSGNNKTCNTTQADAPLIDMPLKDSDINSWKDDGAAGGTITGNTTISSPTSMGPKKIVGNLTISSTLTITGTIYVTGNVIISGTVKLSPTYGGTSGMIISDGYIDISNSTVFEDSGTAGSYIMLLTTSNCDTSISTSPCLGKDAITIGNNSSITIANAQKGTVYFANNSSVREAVGYKIRLKNNSTISYGTGIINATFTSGPAGGYVLTSVSEIQ